MLTKVHVNEIKKIQERIEARKEHQYAAPTYKDVDDLKSIRKIIVDNFLADEDGLMIAYYTFAYLGECYAMMGRRAQSAKDRSKAVQLAAELKNVYGKDVERIEEVYNYAIFDRNYYVKDICLDLRDFGTQLFEDGLGMYLNANKKHPTLKNDPVEMTEEYLSVIDEVERLIDENITYRGMGSCFEYWDLKTKYLAERGVNWTAPNILNPGVHFD